MMKRRIDSLNELAELADIPYDGFHGLQRIKPIIAGMKVGDKLNLNNCISELIEKGENFGRFFVTVPPLGFFNPHRHEVPESIIPKVGSLACDLVAPGKIFKEKEEMFIDKFDKHAPRNPSIDSTAIWDVRFIW